ncbi:MAG: hypothetical protein HW421_3519 [Ignavibacteria bacterium]|nr:hypothetical protein [Ignavibacteria bacterium]
MKINYSAYSDVELVALLKGKKADCEAAFNELYKRYAAPVNAYCLRVLGVPEHAEDIFQETFIKFYQHVRSDYAQTNIQGFLIRIARNLCLNAKRDRKQTVPIEELDLWMHEINSYEKREFPDLLAMALDLLDLEYREAFVLREYDGFSYEEISKLCNITIPNAKTRVFRAKQKIKDILTPYMGNILNAKAKI